jgi:hypothetical protein
MQLCSLAIRGDVEDGLQPCPLEASLGEVGIRGQFLKLAGSPLKSVFNDRCTGAFMNAVSSFGGIAASPFLLAR